MKEFLSDSIDQISREDISMIQGKNFIAALFNFNKQLIWLTTAGYFKDFEQRKDATQNVAHKMCRQGESFWRKKFKEQIDTATLVITTKNICLDMIDSRKNRIDIPNQIIEIGNQNIPYISSGAIEEDENFERAIQILKPIIEESMGINAAKVFSLYIRGYSNPEISGMIGIETGTVGVIKHRIIKLITPYKEIIKEAI